MTQKHEPFGDLTLGEEETYDALAACYDDMTADVDYPAWADFIEALFAGSPCPVHGEPFHTVLDLACGTGTMSFLLAERGYEVIGVDFSPEMLAVAAEKSLEGEGEAPIFLCQSMEKLDLYGTVDACVCLLDSVNHVTEPDRLQQALRRVWLFLEAGGLFIFDVHTQSTCRAWTAACFWMRPTMPTASGARSMTRKKRSAPMAWTSSSGKGRPGTAPPRSTRSGPIPSRP